MVDRDQILNYLNEFLKVQEFDDYCINGLQVEGKAEIKKVICAVSVSQRLFSQAVKRNADLIIVHHGLFWRSDPSPFFITGLLKNRLALLLKNDINLAGYHLPLDAHPKIGNNAQIMKRLNLTPIKPVDVGFLGELKTETDRDGFINLVNAKIDTEAQIFNFGRSKIRRVLVVSGGGSRLYPMALENKVDVFISGEIKENVVRELEESGLNYINAGHYNTEKFGIQALCQQIANQFNLNCEFIDIPNPV